MERSFVLHTNYRKNIERLTMEQRGELFTAILNRAAAEPYAELDPITDMAMSFIASQLDRDLEKWQKIKENRAEAGRKGGKKSGEIRKDKAEQSQANEASASQSKQTKL